MFPRWKDRFDLGARGSAVVLGLALAGCRQIVGFDEGSPGAGVDASLEASVDAAVDAAADAGPYLSQSGYWAFQDPICGACVDRSCHTEAVGCAGDGSCTLYEACIAACGRDQECASHCADQVPSSSRSPETWTLKQCVVTGCSDACPASIVTSQNSQKTCGALFTSAACASCCCDEAAACQNDPACSPACGMQCQTGDALGLSCFAQCTGRPGAQYSDTQNQIGECVGSDKCASVCQFDDWSCLGKVQIPQRQAAGPVFLYGSLVDFPAGNPLAGFTVKTCPFGQAPTCMPVDTPQVTDASGNFLVDLGKTVATNGYALSTYFEVTAPAGLDYPTYLFFLPSWAMVHSLRDVFVAYARNGTGSVNADPSLGDVLFFAHDCQSTLNPPGAAGIQVTASPGGSNPTAYVDKDLQSDPSAVSTYPYGVGYIQNLPPGRVTLTAQLAATQQRIGQTAVWIRADATTVVDLAPTP